MSSELSRPPSPESLPDSPYLFPMGYLNSLSLDRLVRDEGSEYANAFTLLGTHNHNVPAATGPPSDDPYDLAS
jgi:hypothetical protein